MKIINGRGYYRALLFFLFLAMISPKAVKALDVRGIINADSTWTTSDSPVYITGDLLVTQGATLTIQPGVEVVFQPRTDTARGYYLNIEGTLTAQGDNNQPIVFTAQDRDLPWGAIVFRDTSVDWSAAQSMGSILSYCAIEYGGNDPDSGAMIVTQNAMPRIADNVIRFSSAAGIAAFAADGAISISGDIQIVDNQIHNNATGLLLAAEGGLAEGNYFLNNARAIHISTRSSGVILQSNTIMGSSGELFGSGVLLELDEPASGITDYHWEQTGGPTVVLENPNSVQPSFTAPDPGSGVYILSFDLTVTGSSGMQSTESVEVTVLGSNEPPVAVAGGILNVQLSDDPTEAVEVTLSGAGSHDPFIGIAGYRWAQVSGRLVSLSQPNSVTPSFTVPASVRAGEQMSFRLTVTDQAGLQDSDTVDVRFYLENIYPVANVVEDITAVQGDTVTLDGSGSRDPDGGITAYQWFQTGGTPVTLFNSNTAKPFFVAPSVDGSGETLTFSLGVLDNGGLMDAAELSVHIKGTTSADPGEDQTVSADDQVTLNGSGSIDRDSSADIDIEANLIQSDNADAGLVSITAVEGAKYQLRFSGNNLSFADETGYALYLFDWAAETSESLDMTENWWGTTDQTEIDEMIYDQLDDLQLPVADYEPFATQAVDGAGSDLTYPPLANAGSDLVTSVDLNVTLDGSNSYDPDGIGTYQWLQIEGPAVTLNNSQSPIASFVAPSGGADGQLLRFRLTMTTNGGFAHTDEVSVTINADEPAPVVEVNDGCFIQSTTSQCDDKNKMGTIMITTIVGTLFGLLFLLRQRKLIQTACIIALSIVFVSEASAGFFAIGGGDEGDAEQYNITLEAGAKDIALGNFDFLFAMGMPFIPHGDENLPEGTIASSCPNDDCEELEAVRKGTEVGLYIKFGFEIGSTNLYLNAIGGFTVYTESELRRSPASSMTYEESSDTTIEPLYGGGLSYFPDYFDWPILIQADYDITRGVTVLIGWYW